MFGKIWQSFWSLLHEKSSRSKQHFWRGTRFVVRDTSWTSSDLWPRRAWPIHTICDECRRIIVSSSASTLYDVRCTNVQGQAPTNRRTLSAGDTEMIDGEFNAELLAVERRLAILTTSDLTSTCHETSSGWVYLTEHTATYTLTITTLLTFSRRPLLAGRIMGYTLSVCPSVCLSVVFWRGIYLTWYVCLLISHVTWQELISRLDSRTLPPLSLFLLGICFKWLYFKHSTHKCWNF